MAKQRPRGPALTLDDQLCFALYAASRAMTAQYRGPLSALGLTYPQYLVVVLLLEHGSSSVGYLGDRLHLDSSTLSPLIKRLEATGLVTKTRDVTDERSVLVELTPAGAGLSKQIGAVNADICAATGMDANGRRELVAELEILTDRLIAEGSDA